jgi:hypothetical protein
MPGGGSPALAEEPPRDEEPDGGVAIDDGVPAPDADSPQPSTLVRLSDLATASELGFTIQGTEPGDYLGDSGARAGDVNGDGFSDIVVGAPGVGRAYVVFGSSSPSTVALSVLNSQGFVIEQAVFVAGAGDVNGDRLDDVLVYAQYDAAYIVFGKQDSATVSLSDLGNSGFEILASDIGVLNSFASAGDVNGDGYDDVVAVVITETPYASPVFVVFGKADAEPVALSTLGAGGFRIDGAITQDVAVTQASPGGDINGDGLDDIITIGSQYKAHVIFGKRDGEGVLLTAIEAGDGGGFAIDYDFWGDFAKAAGDVNGDGLDDVLMSTVSDYLTPFDGEYVPAVTQVVFGKKTFSPVLVGDVRPDARTGFVVRGDGVLMRAAGAGDVNGDGADDLIFGAASEDIEPVPTSGPCRVDTCAAGMAYIAFGERRPEAVADVGLTDIKDGIGRGFPVRGVNRANQTGAAVSGAGDVDGDGIDDVLIGAPGNIFDERNETVLPDVGRAFVLFGAEPAGLVDRLGERTALLGSSSDDVLVYDGTRSRGSIAGGNGIDTLRPTGLSAVSLEQARFQRLALGPADGPPEVTYSTRVRSVEIVDLTEGGATTLILDDEAVRRLPDSRAGLPFGLAKTLIVLGTNEDRVSMDIAPFELAGTNEGRRVYRRTGAFYGLEVSEAVSVGQ